MIRYSSQVAAELHRIVYYTNVVDAGLHQHVVVNASREIFAALARLRDHGFDPFKERPPAHEGARHLREPLVALEGDAAS